MLAHHTALTALQVVLLASMLSSARLESVSPAQEEAGALEVSALQHNTDHVAIAVSDGLTEVGPPSLEDMLYLHHACLTTLHGTAGAWKQPAGGTRMHS